MTRNRIVTLAKRRFEEGTSSSRFSDPNDWEEWVEEAQLMLFPEGLVQAQPDFSVAANDYLVRLPDRWARTKAVYWGTTVLVYATVDDMENEYGGDWFSETGTPAFWMFSPPSAIRLVPIPTAAGTMHLFGMLYPRLLVKDGTEPEYPEFLHQGLVWGACMIALAQDKDLQGSPVALAHFETNFQRYYSLGQGYINDNGGQPLIRGGSLPRSKFGRPRYTGEL